ncbi:amidase [Caulobacter ginsengisoli]|uniref:Amidase n=1 Tax=Caulobacter ginsengisoli TaxID=400775 RepID=A0ABU0INJ5_9CAUL|nr:amidase [Caulobacter ginsengisoli]MDQ0463569.1 amidase [Caulobacter ginsengisoli]
MRKAAALSTAAALALAATSGVAAMQSPPKAEDVVGNASQVELRDGLDTGNLSSKRITMAYFQRIFSLDRPREELTPAEQKAADAMKAGAPAGQSLRSIIALNNLAMAQAHESDLRYRAGAPLGPLDGLPILVKDNIETKDAMATTAGSLALKDNITGRDAPIIARLRAGGVVILGKANLSEWANIRSDNSISGWSATGGQTRNPYALDRNTCGSSSGSGAAVAAGLAWAAIGTETDGSITCPAAINGIVGLKPTVGLLSRTYIVPISHSQDTPGPMTRTVRDAALMLNAMAGSDPADAATKEADARKVDYTAGLKPDALKGVRIGVMRYAAGFHPGTDAEFEKALAVLKAQGATLVEVKEFPNRDKIGGDELIVLLTELKADLNSYLASTDPLKVKTRTLADVIAFNKANADKEMPLFGQELFEKAQATKGLTDPDYIKARDEAKRLAGPEGIDALLKADKLDALVAPTLGPAWLIDPVLGDRFVGGGAGGAAAVAGYPHLTVPMGSVRGLPVGLSFVGAAWSEARLLAYGYAFEQATHARRMPSFLATISE